MGPNYLKHPQKSREGDLRPDYLDQIYLAAREWEREEGKGGGARGRETEGGEEGEDVREVSEGPKFKRK